MSVAGYRPAFIARYVQETEPDLSRRSIERHLQNHVNYEQAALREILEQRAKEAGILTDEARQNILTRKAVLDQFLQQTWNRLTGPDGGKVPFEIGLKALELQEMMEREAEAAVVDQVTRQLDAIIRAIRELVPQEYHEALARRAEQIYEQPALAELEPPHRDLPALDMDDD